jgi:hypothetical protein
LRLGDIRGDLSIVREVGTSGDLFVEFLDFSEGINDVIFVIDVLWIDFKGTSTTLSSTRKEGISTLRMKLTISVMADVSSSS